MELMQRRRELLAMQSELPMAYRKVEWIGAEGTSHPYIDTGLSVDAKSFPEATIHFYNDKNEAFVFGTRLDMSKPPYFNLNVMADTEALRFDYGTKKPTNAQATLYFTPKNGELQFEIHNNLGQLTNIATGISNNPMNYSGTRFNSKRDHCLLFAVMTGSNISIDSDTGSLRIYSAKFWIADELVRDFIPCVRKTDNVVGMYDKVTKQFFTSVNSDTFTIPT